MYQAFTVRYRKLAAFGENTVFDVYTMPEIVAISGIAIFYHLSIDDR